MAGATIGTPAPAAAANGTERTPLLRGEHAPNGSVEANAPREEEPTHEGMPEVLARMHILLPAIGIGVSPLFRSPVKLWTGDRG